MSLCVPQRFITPVGGAACCVVWVLGALCAHAETTEPVASAITANASVISQYVSRGFRQTWGEPALQVGVDYVHPNGWSLGTWVSTVSDRYIEDATVEWDLYGGYGGAAGGFGYSILGYYYKYPGAEYRATGTKYDYGELSLGLTYGVAYAKYNHTVTRDFFGVTNARGTGYLDLGANLDMGGGYTLNLHAGNGRVAGTGNAIWNWRDAKLGVSRAFNDGWNVSAAWTRAWAATDVYDHYTLGIPNRAGAIESSNPAAATWVCALTKTF
ncbi:TorF family putative porin [Undibacterium parvum]|uniref:Choline dehydrogenase n=2 Tax=Undibacterium TaxID=401469 RepID=A0A6M4A5Y6_9BURK|nr:TorF family putative porin [Undibacterium parvum]AZP10903.1 choline dehydrogenase [Undibacterium parvum]QJQ05479.1 choline dehydrogenase [Undibacterium piscinae]